MTKHRLELFSDGVLAFVMTLLALDLRPQHAVGVASLLGATPPLIVHAVTFALAGFLWMALHHTVEMVEEIRPKSLIFNVLALVWLLLMPFAAKVAAENPLDPLGPSLLAACYGLFTASTVGLRLASRGALYEPPDAQRWFLLGLRQYGALAALRLVLAALAWVSPWFGYAALATVFASFFLGPPSPLPADATSETGPDDRGAPSAVAG